MIGNGEGYNPTTENVSDNVIQFNGKRDLANAVMGGSNENLNNGNGLVDADTGERIRIQERAEVKDNVLKPPEHYFDPELGLEVVPYDKYGHRDDQIGNIYHTDNPNPQFLRDILVPKKEDPNLERDIESFLSNQTKSAQVDIERRVKDYLKSNDIPFTKESGINILVQKYRNQEALKKDKQKLVDLQAEIHARQSIPANVIGMDGKPLQQSIGNPDLISEVISDPSISTPESLTSKQNAMVKKLEGMRDDPNIKRLYEQIKQGGNVLSNTVETINKVRTATPGKMVKMFGGQLVKGFMGLFSSSDQQQSKAA